MSEIKDLRAQVAIACRIIGRLGLTRETNGHVSARIPGTETAIIKARGPDEAALSYAEDPDLIVVDFDGKKLEGRDGLASPAEVYIHTRLYRARPELGSVIHIHPQAIVAFTIAEKPILPIIGAYNPSGLRLVQDGIPLYARSVLINTNERGDELANVMGTSNACLMRGHGITTAGRTVEESTLTAIHLNELAELHYRANLLGGAHPIPDEDLEEFRAMNARTRTPQNPLQTSSEWRYYIRRFGGA